MSVTVLNDLHLGVQRCAGTTPASALALRNWLMESYTDFINDLPDDETLLLNGDVFDAGQPGFSTVMEFVRITAAWVSEGTRKVLLSRGNHDLSKDGALSGFDFAGQVLSLMCGNRVTVITQPHKASFGYVIPHLANQSILDLELQAVPAGCYVFLHANVDCCFSQNSDHSLSVSRNQIETLIAQGNTLVFAHDHRPREEFGGKVIVTGCFLPTSVGDCIGSQYKHALRLEALHG